MKFKDTQQVRKELTDFFNSKRKFAELDIHGRVKLKQFSEDSNKLIAEVLNIHKKQLLVIADIILTRKELKKK
jgi:hypothetical protein